MANDKKIEQPVFQELEDQDLNKVVGGRNVFLTKKEWNENVTITEQQREKE